MLETVFSACGALAMIGWLGLALLPGKPVVVNVLARLVIPGLIGVVYVFTMATNIGAAPDGGDFGSLAGVKLLFSADALLLAGWIHYLAFDLFVGSWEVADARTSGVPHLLVLPCLFATLMAGPGGLLLYLAVKYGYRAISRKPAQEQPA